MSTCPACHQPIPQTCDICPEQIVFHDGNPVSYQNHFKSKLHRENVNGKVKAPELSFGKKATTAEEDQSLVDAIRAESVTEEQARARLNAIHESIRDGQASSL